MRPRGFTLIELLVGLTISTLILGAAAGVLVTVLRAWEQGSQTYGVLHTAQAVADLIERHLRSAQQPSWEGEEVFWGDDLSMGEAKGHRLTFFSSAAGRFPRSNREKRSCCRRDCHAGSRRIDSTERCDGIDKSISSLSIAVSASPSIV